MALVFSIYNLLCIIPVMLLIWRMFFQRRRETDEPPLITGWIPWIGCGMAYRKDGYSFLKRMQEKHGPVFTVYMGGRYITFATDPRCYNDINKAKASLTFRDAADEFFAKVFDGVISKKAEALRETMPRYLQGNGLQHMNEVTLQNLQNVLDEDEYCTEDWRLVSLLDFTYQVMFPAGFKSLFGDWDHAQGAEKANSKMPQLIADFITFDDNFVNMAIGYPVIDKQKLQAAKQRLWRVLSERSSSENIHELIANRHQYLKDTNQYSRSVNEDMTLLWASQSNTNMVLFWTLYFLLKHPEAYNAVRSEVDEATKQGKILKKKLADIFSSKEVLDEMVILESVLKETSRLAVSPMSVRAVTEDFRLDVPLVGVDFRIRKGDTLLMAYALTHFDPDIYLEPEKFIYNRFVNKDGTEKKTFFKQGKKVHYYLQPFGSGQSKCPGRYWANSELKQAVCLLLATFDMELVDLGEDVRPSNSRFGFGALHPTCKPLIRHRMRC